MIKDSHYDSDGRLTGYTLSQYDADGNCLGYEFYDGDGNLEGSIVDG